MFVADLDFDAGRFPVSMAKLQGIVAVVPVLDGALLGWC